MLNLKNKYNIYSVLMVFLLAICFVHEAFATIEKVKGYRCYTYSDNDNFNEAREYVKSLAIEEAIMFSQTYIESITEIENGYLKKQLIKSIKQLHIKINNIQFDEYKQQNKICCKVELNIIKNKINDTITDIKKKPPIDNPPIDNPPFEYTQNQINPDLNIISDCKCEELSESCMYTLQGYEPGEYLHKDLETFVSFVLATLNTIKMKNIIELSIEGYADGLPDDNMDKKWSDIPNLTCQYKQFGKLNDKDLATVRACIVKESIENSLGEYAILWDEKTVIKPIDYKDYTVIGDKYRKVLIKYRVGGECENIK